MHRSDKVRGPYIRPDTYERLSQLADMRDENIGNTLDALVHATLSQSGDIVANQVNAKITWDLE